MKKQKILTIIKLVKMIFTYHILLIIKTESVIINRVQRADGVCILHWEKNAIESKAFLSKSMYTMHS